MYRVCLTLAKKRSNDAFQIPNAHFFDIFVYPLKTQGMSVAANGSGELAGNGNATEANEEQVKRQ